MPARRFTLLLALPMLMVSFAQAEEPRLIKASGDLIAIRIICNGGPPDYTDETLTVKFKDLDTLSNYPDSPDRTFDESTAQELRFKREK